MESMPLKNSYIKDNNTLNVYPPTYQYLLLELQRKMEIITKKKKKKREEKILALLLLWLLLEL